MPNHKIFIVEDDNNLADLCQMAFGHEGFNAEVAYDGDEGLRRLKAMKAKPDAILLDIMMPNLNGFEFLSTLKTMPEVKDVPVVVLTNLSQKEDMEKVKKLGASLYLVKSQNEPHQIVAKVKELLKK